MAVGEEVRLYTPPRYSVKIKSLLRPYIFRDTPHSGYTSATNFPLTPVSDLCYNIFVEKGEGMKYTYLREKPYDEVDEVTIDFNKTQRVFFFSLGDDKYSLTLARSRKK